MSASSRYTTSKANKSGGQWEVLEWQMGEGPWDEAVQEFCGAWVQVGPYWDTEAEAEAAIAALDKVRVTPSNRPEFDLSLDERPITMRTEWGNMEVVE